LKERRFLDMELMEIIKQRRSIRRYQSKEIPEEVLSKVLEAFQWAPSFGNAQCWELIIIKDPAIKEALQATLAKGNPAKKSITKAPLLIAICAKLKNSGYDKGEALTQIGDWAMYDLGMANQNLCLMAHNLGLGTVVVAWFDHDRVNEILEVPSGYKALTIIPLGYPVADAKAPDRRKIGDFTHENKFAD
jgi:nitroreductase